MTLLMLIAFLFGMNIEGPVYAVPYDMVSTCDVQDQEHAFIDVETNTLYGDQDSNGILDGEDCNWR